MRPPYQDMVNAPYTRPEKVNLIASYVSVNPKLDHIFSVVGDRVTRGVFHAHGILDLWLPIPKQTLRRLFADDSKEKQFLAAQESITKSTKGLLSRDSSILTTTSGHASIEDDEDLVEEFRLLGEGAYGTVEEVTVNLK